MSLIFVKLITVASPHSYSNLISVLYNFESINIEFIWLLILLSHLFMKPCHYNNYYIPKMLVKRGRDPIMVQF